MIKPVVKLAWLLLLAVVPAAAQRKPATAPDPFAPVNWFELKPPSAEAPAGAVRPGGLDLGLRASPDEIYVFGHRQKIEPRVWQRQDFNNPHYIEAAGPRDRLEPPRTSCPGAAYRDIGGQPGTGRDTVGVLGAGGC